MKPKFDRNSSTGFEGHFGPSGGLLGPFWGRCWAHVGVLFRSSAGKADFVENVLPPTWEHDFPGSEGLKNHEKRGRKQCAAGGVLQERLGRLSGSIWEHFGLHF